MSSSLPIPLLYAQTLRNLLPLLDDTTPSSSSSYQPTLQKCLDDLHLISRMITSLGIFSDNESLSELSDGAMVFMTISWVVGETESRGGVGGVKDRKEAIGRGEAAYNAFLGLLSNYQVLSPEEEAESSSMANGAMPVDPARKREAKIRQYRREKDLRGSISELAPDHPPSSSSPILFILSLLPKSQSTSSTSVNPETPNTRPLSLLLLRLLHTLSLASLSSSVLELEILASAPPDSTDADEPRIEAEDDTWRLDRAPPGTVRPRQLISGGGRVLRPFTILPSTSSMSDRERLRGEVFRQSHRLPTMTIDEYLQEEERNGNFISGGGPASQNAPTSSELLALEAEDDGTLTGRDAAEKKRVKEENWATWTEANPRGAGNTLNRG